MKRLKISLPVGLMSMLLLLCQGAMTQIVDKTTAHTVAENWIATIVNYQGQWAGANTAHVADITEFARGDRVLGYYCTVDPDGYILVSLIEGLSPVKGYSETYRFDPASDDGLADLLKIKMESSLDAIERIAGPIEFITSDEWTKIPGLNRRDTWRRLKAGPVATDKKFSPSQTGGDYQEGDILLTSNWHQGEPYYNLCPAPPQGSSCTDPHCAVGCVATAGAQLMRYWSWPPDPRWITMPDAMAISPTPTEEAAVSEICHEIGSAVGMVYCDGDGCGSSAYTYHMVIVYEAWSYHTNCTHILRSDYSQKAWWNIIKGQINKNHPIQYRIKSHSIVCDGWKEITDPEYHMNYGWADNANTWYFIDSLFYPDTTSLLEDEYMVINVFPKVAMGPSISGTYPDNPSYPYRYIDQDCSAASVVFEPGQLIQFLQDKVMTCTSGYLHVYGTPSKNTRLYSGDTGHGALVHDGRIMLYPGASIQLGLERPD